MIVYFISGLGVDHRAFQRISLPGHSRIIHIKWIEPKKRESLSDYVKRLSNQINTQEEFSLVGLSFGGVIAIELNKFLKPRKTILISSLTDVSQLPLLYKTIGKLRLNRLLPGRFIKNPIFLVYWLFGLRHKKDKQLLREILKDTSPTFLSWAIDRLLHWKNDFVPGGLVRIHGKNDKLVPPATNNQYLIDKAGHLMVYTHGPEVSRILTSELK